MAILNTNYYCSEEDNLYSDGQIECEMYNRVCQKDNSIYQDNRWEMFYHFSPLRENILNWYPFDKTSTVLEIGGGCGALTGLLVGQCGKVISCELTMQRAKILYERHKQSKNLDVIVGNFMRIKFEEKFDYIVINGVLEYAKNIMDKKDGNPFEDFLLYVKSLLKNDGKILLAIENRFGLKYFNGAPEDHTGVIFDGTNSYINGTDVRTFSKNELIKLCSSVNLSILKWYYPYPDYKFPTEIFTDDSINTIFPLTTEVPFDQDRVELFDKKAVYKGFMADEIMDHFSNSFLVELGHINQSLLHRPTYVKISNNRKKEFSICTLLYEDELKVEKKALYFEGFQHLLNMYQSGNEDETILSSSYQSGILTSVMLKNCETLYSKLINMYEKNDRDGFWHNLNEIKKLLFTGQISKQREKKEFTEVFGSTVSISPMHWKTGVNIDLNAENVFFKDEKIIIIDNEWIFYFPIPVEYAFWRLLLQMRESIGDNEWLSDESIVSFLQIDIKDFDIYKKWEQHFASKYVGIRDLTDIQKTVYSVSLHDVIADKIKHNTLQSQLFLFFDNDEYEIIQGQVSNDNGIWTVCFKSEHIANAKAIRWDPLEGEASRIYGINSGGLSLKQINAYSEDAGQYVFTTYDPQFSVVGDWSELAEIKIVFQCEILDWTNGYFLMECERNKEHDKLEQLEVERRDERKQLENELGKTTEKLDIITKELGKTRKELSITEEELDKTTKELSITEEELDKTTKELSITEEKLGKTTKKLNITIDELTHIKNKMELHPWKCAAKILLKKKI